MTTKKVSPKQEAFVREYQIDRNGTQAAIRAGYSEKTAQEQSCRLLSNVKVQEAIDAAAAQHAKRCNVTVDNLTAELIADRELARENKHPGAAITATMSIAKLHGLDITRAKIDAGVNVHDTLMESVTEARKRLAVSKKHP